MDTENEKVQVAYEAWSNALGGMVPAGFTTPYRLPDFEQLSTHVRSAWDAAVAAIEPPEEPEVTVDLEPAGAATTSEK